MNKITLEEALEIIRNNITKAYTYACYNKSTKQNTSVLEEQTHRMVDFLFEQLKTPTLDEVVKAWEEDEDLEVISHYDDIIKVRRKGTSIIEYYFKSLGVEVRTGIVYSRHQKAYDLTIKYLESYKEETK